MSPIPGCLYQGHYDAWWDSPILMEILLPFSFLLGIISLELRSLGGEKARAICGGTGKMASLITLYFKFHRDREVAQTSIHQLHV